MKTLTYLVPNDMRREPERPILPEHPAQKLVNEVAEKVAPGHEPPRIVFSGPVFASCERASFGVATIGVPALDGVPVDVVRSDMTAATMRAAAQAAERAAHPLITVTVEPLKPTPEEARLYRELTEQIRLFLCGSLTDSVIALPPGCEVEYLEADAVELPYALAVSPEPPGSWALGPVHDETKVKP